MKFCVECGRALADTAKFCGSCGAPAAPAAQGANAGPAGGTSQPQPGPQSYEAVSAHRPMHAAQPQQPAPVPQTASTQPLAQPQPIAPTQPIAQQPYAPQQAAPAPSFAPPASAAPAPAFPVPAGAGAPVTGADAALAPAARARHGWRIAAIIAAVVAVAVGGTLAWAIPNVPAVRQLLGMGPKNPGAVTMQVLQSTQDVSSAKFNMTFEELNGSTPTGNKVTIDGKYALGANTDASLFDVQVSDPSDDASGRLVWSGGAFGGQITGDGFDDQYAYVDVNGMRDDLQKLLEYELDATTAKQYTDLVFNVKDAIVKDGKIDSKGALKVFNDGMSAIDDEYAKEYRKYMPNEAVNQQYADFVNAFFTKGLEDSAVQARVFPGKTETKVDGGTKLSYDLNMVEFAHELANYWTANQNSYPDLRKTLVDAAGSEADFNDAVKQMQDWNPDSDEVPGITVAVTYGSGYRFDALEVTLKEPGGGSEAYRMNLTVSDQNKVSADDADAAQFMSTAKQKNTIDLGKLMDSSYSSSSYYY
ncbi:dihydrolipoamide succinyltransferase [Bifidobacterium sp. DSM 109958]|uniref:Dihydrolipoamide succinyltransferase n=2 Tax=Bifidobacterium moraviense TaxID=2675323 RepID=A0A7Y0F3F2_9BIFI|nr:zinc ribbon domain-containing protein [Bifidobacterium sp. DSM 109958]NMN01288.1 dihydrolipoamide succinyltransferase [Bifidobacterium sp. DSM 109958]